MSDLLHSSIMRWRRAVVDAIVDGRPVPSLSATLARDVGDSLAADMAFAHASELDEAISFARPRSSFNRALEAMQVANVEKLQKEYKTEALRILSKVGRKAERKLRAALLDAARRRLGVRRAVGELAKVFDQFNVEISQAQLATIYQTQVQIARNAGRWAAEFADPDIWGWRYVTARDERVRPTHRALDRMALPKNHPLWLTYWPPNGWNCRCTTVPLRYKAKYRYPGLIDGERPKPDEGFEFNAGDALQIKLAFDPLQPRDKEGKWTDTGARRITFEDSGYFKFGTNTIIPAVRARKMLSELGLTEENIRDAVGAPTEARIRVNPAVNSAGEVIGVRVRVNGEDTHAGEYSMERLLTLENGERVAINTYFGVKHSGTGFGVKAFSRQVETLAKAKFVHIETYAARDDNEDAPMVGYKVWPRLGYDAKIPDWARDEIANERLSEAGVRIKNPAITKAIKISDLMRTPEGRNFWDEFGDGYTMHFDLREGSLSRQILDAYNKQKAGIKLAFDPNQPRDEEGKWTDTGAHPFDRPKATTSPHHATEISYESAAQYRPGQEPRKIFDAQARMHALGLTEATIAAAVGAPPKSKIVIKPITGTEWESGIDVRVDGTDDYAGAFSMQRFLFRQGGELKAVNSHFLCQHTGTGFGVAALTRQVETLSAAKFSVIETFAARDEESDDVRTHMVGYKVWPRLGFDCKIPNWARVPAKDFTDGDKLSDLMRDPDGRAWWDKNGEGEEMEFDLRPGSRSREILATYNQRRAAKNARQR